MTQLNLQESMAMTDMLSHAARMIEEEGAAAEEGGRRSRLRTLAPLVAT